MAIVTIRTIPVLKTAMQLTATCDLDEMCEFLGGEGERNLAFSINYVQRIVRIGTLEGTMTATVGDWIVRGVQGEYYPVKPEVFAQSYEIIQIIEGLTR